MNYTEMATYVSDTIEDTFEAQQMVQFFTAVEEFLYTEYDLPSTRVNATSQMSAGNEYVTLPSDYLSPYSFTITVSGTGQQALQFKDVNFIREAYPDRLTVGAPKYYAQYDEDSFIVGPTPDDFYAVQLHYLGRPESITTANTNWLGDNYPQVLIAGAMVEAARFIKAEAEDMQIYDKAYADARRSLESYAKVRQRHDAFRSGRERAPINRG